MPSPGHVALYGFINFWNQVFLLLYKNFTRIIRTPWTLIIFILFPSLMLGLLFGLQSTLVTTFGAEDVSAIRPSKCNPMDAPFVTKSCITLGYSDDNSFEKADRNYKALQVLAKELGWTIGPQGDTSMHYDIVYFGFDKTNLEVFNYYNETWLKYVVTHRTDFEFLGQNTGSLNAENYYVQVGGPNNFDMGLFGFADHMNNPAARTVPALKELLMDAYIAVRQAETNGWDVSQSLMPNIHINKRVVDRDGESVAGSGFSTGDFFVIGGPLIIWISLFSSQLYLSSQILEDRRKKLRLGMVMMGLNTGSYQVSWFLWHCFLSSFYSAVALGIGHACKFAFFTQTNPAVIFLLYWLTSCAAIGFTMMTTALVHHPTGHTALMVCAFLIGLGLAVASSITFAGIYRIFWLFSGSDKLWLFNYNFQFGNIVRSIAQATLQDNNNNGTKPYFGWKDIHQIDYITPTLGIPSVATSFGSMILCAFLGLIFSIYLEIVFPREIGSPQGFVFFLFPSYWGFDTKSRLNVETVTHRSNKMSDVAVDLDPDVMAEYNDVMSRLNTQDPTLALAVTKISKTFQKKRVASEQDTRAVDAVTLGADSGSVLGIVGHNGAGKTTLMSMLCGVVSVSTGDARVFGHSISQNMTAIHQVMGVCPQEDVLWPELTPHEHLKLFAILKRIPWSQHETVIQDSLNEVGLLHVKDRISNKLSGGMKRRLSVAIALIGNIKIIMLDEPTAGLDPRNRLEIWSIIERIKKNRVVILTTHSMLEASSLADKIAVMAVGRLRGIGTPQHLVQRFGKGHQISIVSKVSKTEEVKALVTQLLPDAELEVDTGARLTYSLAASKSRQLPDFCRFMEADNNTADLIEDWGVSQTTLEQVFLRLTHGGGNQEGLSSAALQLNVAYEGSDDILGFVPILPNTTLDETRELIRANLPQIPESFTFIFNKAPVAHAQERSTSAYRALPVIELRVAGGVAGVGLGADLMSNGAVAPRHKKPAAIESMDVNADDSVPLLKARIAELEAQLQDREQLLATVDKLEKKVAKLKAKLKDLQAINASAL